MSVLEHRTKLNSCRFSQTEKKRKDVKIKISDGRLRACESIMRSVDWQRDQNKWKFVVSIYVMDARHSTYTLIRMRRWLSIRNETWYSISIECHFEIHFTISIGIERQTYPGFHFICVPNANLDRVKWKMFNLISFIMSLIARNQWESSFVDNRRQPQKRKALNVGNQFSLQFSSHETNMRLCEPINVSEFKCTIVKHFGKRRSHAHRLHSAAMWENKEESSFFYYFSLSRYLVVCAIKWSNLCLRLSASTSSRLST